MVYQFLVWLTVIKTIITNGVSISGIHLKDITPWPPPPSHNTHTHTEDSTHTPTNHTHPTPPHSILVLCSTKDRFVAPQFFALNKWCLIWKAFISCKYSTSPPPPPGPPWALVYKFYTGLGTPPVRHQVAYLVHMDFQTFHWHFPLHDKLRANWKILTLHRHLISWGTASVACTPGLSTPEYDKFHLTYFWMIIPVLPPVPLSWHHITAQTLSIPAYHLYYSLSMRSDCYMLT